MNGVTFTKKYAWFTVVYGGHFFVVDFPYDRELVERMKTIPGATWNSEAFPRKWVVPTYSFPIFRETFPKIPWKTDTEIERQMEWLRRKEETLSDVLSRISTDIDMSFMKKQPYHFQKLAIAWAAAKKGFVGITGGVLADTMGLGKTVSGMGFALYMKDHYDVKRTLIICPATLKHQWGQQIKHFSHERFVIIDSKNKKNRREYRKKLYESVREDNIFFTITNFELLIRKEKEGSSYRYPDLEEILKNEYDCIVVDEAHTMKNPLSERAQAIRHIQASHKLLMTGTPVEKEIADAFQLFDYLHGSILSDASYSFENRLEDFQDKFLWMAFDGRLLPRRVYRSLGQKNQEVLRRRFEPFMLRRTTKDVKGQIPEHTVSYVEVEWEKNQKDLYDSIQDRLVSLQELLGNVFSMMEQTSNDKKVSLKQQIERLEAEEKMLLGYLQQVANTPESLFLSNSASAKRLLSQVPFFAKILQKKIIIDKSVDEDPGLSKEEKQHQKQELYDEQKLFEHETFTPPKLKRLLEKVHDITVESEEKVVLFTQSERMTRIMQRRFHQLLNKKGKTEKPESEHIRMMMYSGDTKSGCRWEQKLQKDKQPVPELSCLECPFSSDCGTRTKSAWHFQNDPQTRIIIATDAGNAGVNLQTGKNLINYDLPDIRARYDQRCGRIIRLGSEHEEVSIYNILITDSIDTMKRKKLERQKSIIDFVVENNENQDSLISEYMKLIENQDELRRMEQEAQAELIAEIRMISKK